MQTKIRLLLKKQSDQGLRCLPFHQHLLDALMQCYIKLFFFKDNYGNCLRCPKFYNFYGIFTAEKMSPLGIGTFPVSAITV